MKTAPDPKDVQEFQFKQSHISQILDAYTSIPAACNLLAADRKRGLLYVGQNNKIIVLKPGEDADPEWKIEVDLPVAVSKLTFSCDYSYLAVASQKPSVQVYDAQALAKNNLQLLYEVRISSGNMEPFANDLHWNPSVPGMLCTVASDYTIGSFHIKEEKKKAVVIKAIEKLDGLDVLCAAWSPKGKQIVVGCKNGNIVQLKPDLKVARIIAGPTPYIGGIISILWISNYQFCTAYLGNEQHINVLIVDAPKGEINATFTCYEDITYGMPDAEGQGGIPRYYFDHVPEWGLIIAASSNSSEIAVLGSTDSGATWNQWQLVDSGRAQLPLICTTESYPLGLAIDKSSTRTLPWGADSTLPHPVPILHILGTSGQLCSFHMVNLIPNCPAINSPPTEIVSPPQPRLSIAPAETSMMISGAVATSTPRVVKQLENIPERPKPVPVGNMFGDSLKATGFFQQPQIEKSNPPEPKPLPPVNTEIKVEPVKEMHLQEAPKPSVKLSPVKETVPQESTEQKASIDDSICIRAYLEEHSLFEKELHNRLEPQTWECGTEEERKQLVERAAIIDQFLRELRETTNSLSSDIAYLKALLLQSFAWVEETKSKNAATIDITTRNCEDSSKMSDLQRLYYYTQTQLIQATKILDLEWSEHKSREKSRMKIPSLEFVYQNLVLHNKIIMEEKKKLKQLQDRWKLVVRPNNISGLNRSISSLHITSPKSSALRGNTGVIEARCKTIASKTLSFTQIKQVKLKQMLLESSPRIIKPVNRSPIQDRLEATLSSLASLSTTSVDVQNEVEQPAAKLGTPIQQANEKAKQQSPLASLNSIVARIGTTESNNASPQIKAQNKATTVGAAFPSKIVNKVPQTDKKPVIPATTLVPQNEQKQDTITFGQMSLTNLSLPNVAKGFPTVPAATFGATMQKHQENLAQKALSKDTSSKNSKETIVINDTNKVESNLFSTGTLKDVLSSDVSSGRMQASVPETSTATPEKSDSAATFSFAIPNSLTTTKPIVQDSLFASPTTSAQTFSFTSMSMNSLVFMAKPLTSKVESMLQKPLGPTETTVVALQGSNHAPTQPNKFNEPNESNATEVQSTKPTSPGTGLGNIFATNRISISLLTDNIAKNNTTPTSSVVIEEVPSTESKVPSSTGTIVQSPPVSSTIPLFGNQSSTLNIPMFGGTSTSTVTTAAFSAPTTVSSTSTFGTQPTTSSMLIFSSFNATPTTSIISTATPTSTTPSPFYTSPSKPTFGEVAPNMSMPSFTSVNNSSPALTFGNISAATTTTTTSITSVFVKPAASLLATNAQFPSTPVVSSAGNAFDKPIISPSSIPFGSAPSTTSIFGSMPTTSANTSIFGGNSSAPIFGTNTPSSSAGSIFGGNSTPMTTFGTPTSGSIFQNNAQKPNLLFGASPNAGSTSFFGGTSTMSPTAGGSATGSPSVFGGVAANTSPIGVGGQSVLASQPAFGQAPTFGSTSVFGSPPVFGASKPMFGGFGAATFGASAAPPAFGSPPAMGGSPRIENNMTEVFGSAGGNSTFESLATQSGGLTFGSLAQKSPEAEKPPVFAGGSSFSSWR